MQPNFNQIRLVTIQCTMQTHEGCTFVDFTVTLLTILTRFLWIEILFL